MYDVLAVNIETSKVRILATGKDERNAEAILNMAVMRRGVDEEFFVYCAQNVYAEGDTYNGGGRS